MLNTETTGAAEPDNCPFCCAGDCYVYKHPKAYNVNCDGCCAAGPMGDTEDEAVKLWNERTHPRIEVLEIALNAAIGYMTNVVIDLQLHTRTQTTIDTLKGGLALAHAAIARKEGLENKASLTKLGEAFRALSVEKKQ